MTDILPRPLDRIRWMKLKITVLYGVSAGRRACRPGSAAPVEKQIS